jgi:ribonuclease HI
MTKITLDIYADGACDPNPGIGGWGAVAYQNGLEVWTAFDGDMQTTNNRMEMQGVIAALEYANGRPCYIFSDSQLCVNTLTKWAASWERKGWVRGSGEIKNLDLVRHAYELYRRSQAHIVWVKGHSGNRGNERADFLANLGREKVIQSRFVEHV